MDFSDLSTVKLSEKLAPLADNIYRKEWKVASIEINKKDVMVG